jgi:hypothetical protein
MERKTPIFWGIALILVGGLLVLNQLGVFEDIDLFSWKNIWTVGMLILGVLFHVQFFVSKGHNPGILVPGGILLVYGCMHMYLSINGWHNMSSLWPLYLVGPGFGLLELKLFSRGREGSWVPVIVLFSLATIFFVKFNDFGVFSEIPIVAIVLIVVGIAIILGSIFGAANKKSNKSHDVHVDEK